MPRYIAGKIPHAGSLRAAQFARRRSQELLGQRRRLKAATPSFIPMVSSRWRPAYTSRSGQRFAAGEHPVTRLHQEFPGFGLLPSITSGAQVRLATRYDRFGKKTQLVDIRGFKQDLNRILTIAGLPHIGARFLVWHLGKWCLMQMIFLTPVDTGQAAGAWSISPQLRGKGKGYGRVGFRISNPVSYVIHLEYGHSKQAPQGMQRITFQRARSELRALMDSLILWWKAEQYTLRGFKFDIDMAGGVPYDPEKIEKKIPKMTWKRLVAELRSRLPLDKPVAHLNAEAFLAMRIDDPKDWHTVHDFEERDEIFESRVIRREVQEDVFETADVPVEVGGSLGIHEMTRRVGTRTSIRESVQHVTRQSDLPLSRPDLESQANELQRLWSGRR